MDDQEEDSECVAWLYPFVVLTVQLPLLLASRAA